MGADVSEVSTWRLFAFMDDDEDGERDERRLVADWQVEDALRWCRFRGFDHIYLARIQGDTRRFEVASSADGVVHHLHPRSGSADEGVTPGGDAAA